MFYCWPLSCPAQVESGNLNFKPHVCMARVFSTKHISSSHDSPFNLDRGHYISHSVARPHRGTALVTNRCCGTRFLSYEHIYIQGPLALSSPDSHLSNDTRDLPACWAVYHQQHSRKHCSVQGSQTHDHKVLPASAISNYETD